MYNNCALCKRECGVNRALGERGFCGMGNSAVVAHATLHMWEEPPISGVRGSGAIFFSGCSLKCCYCQNYKISGGKVGSEYTEGELAALMLSLRDRGAHNINLVTPTHFIPSIVGAVREARACGLDIPIVYNTSAYETEDALAALSGTVDIYLPDLKYYKAKTAREYSGAEDLPEVSFMNIERMVKQTGAPKFAPDGIMLSGTVVRILLLPAHLAEAKLNLSRLWRAFGDDVYISLMSQYTPVGNQQPPLNRPVSISEYSELVDYAISLGVKNAFVQDGASASESFIPNFDC